MEQIRQLQSDLGNQAIGMRGDVVDVMPDWRRAIEDLGSWPVLDSIREE